MNAELFTPVTSPDLRVLLVDDHEDMLAMMRLMLRQRCYEVATANSGLEALQVVESFAPHVVVSDIGMPGMDGYEMMIELRARNQDATFKAIALTGHGMDDDHDRARAAGYDAHLVKPVDFDQLFEVIETLATR